MGQLIQLSPEESGKLWYKLSTYENNMYAAWRAECLDNRAFYFGHQATSEEIKQIQERGQHYIVINKIRKAIRGMSGMLASNVPKYKLVAMGDDDNLKAALGNKLLDWGWHNSGGVTTFRRTIKDAQIDNIKYHHVIYSKDKKVKSVLLSFDDVLVDPSSKHPMFEDAEMICIRRYVPIEYVKSVYGVADVVYEVPGSYYEYASNETGAAEAANAFIQKVYSYDKMYVNLYECYRKEFYRTEDTGEVRSKIIKDTVIGFRHSFREELPSPISEYPIIPVYVEDTENPYKRGEIHFLKDLQRFINKSYGVVLLNAQLMSNPKVFLRETDIPSADIEEFQDNYANPGSISVLTGNAEAPIIVQGQPLNSAFFTLYQDAKLEMEAATVSSMQLGTVMPSGMNTSQLLDQREMILDSLKDFTSVIDLACSQLGKVMLQYCSAYLSPEDLLRLLDTTGAQARIRGYLDQGLNVDDEESVSQYIRTAEENNIPVDVIEQNLAQARLDTDFMKALEYYTDMPDFSDMDVVVIPGSYTPTYEMAMMRLMMELAQTGAVDPSVILRYVPSENRQELIERFDTLRKLQGQLEYLEEENKELKSALESLEGEVVTQRINVATIKETSKLEKLKAEEKVKALMRKYEHRLQTREQQQKFKEELTDMLLNIQIEKLKEKEQELDSKQSSNNIEIL